MPYDKDKYVSTKAYNVTEFRFGKIHQIFNNVNGTNNVLKLPVLYGDELNKNYITKLAYDVGSSTNGANQKLQRRFMHLHIERIPSKPT